MASLQPIGSGRPSGTGGDLFSKPEGATQKPVAAAQSMADTNEEDLPNGGKQLEASR